MQQEITNIAQRLDRYALLSRLPGRISMYLDGFKLTLEGWSLALFLGNQECQL